MRTISGELSNGDAAAPSEQWAPTELDVNSDETEFEADKSESLISGPEDPRYFDFRYFAAPFGEQNWFDARIAQVKAIEARQSERPGTIAYQIKARRRAGAAAAAVAGLSGQQAAAGTSGLRLAFPELIPRKPYCADALSDGLAIRARDVALTNATTAQRAECRAMDRTRPRLPRRRDGRSPRCLSAAAQCDRH